MAAQDPQDSRVAQRKGMECSWLGILKRVWWTDKVRAQVREWIKRGRWTGNGRCDQSDVGSQRRDGQIHGKGMSWGRGRPRLFFLIRLLQVSKTRMERRARPVPRPKEMR